MLRVLHGRVQSTKTASPHEQWLYCGDTCKDSVLLFSTNHHYVPTQTMAVLWGHLQGFCAAVFNQPPLRSHTTNGCAVGTLQKNKFHKWKIVQKQWLWSSCLCVATHHDASIKTPYIMVFLTLFNSCYELKWEINVHNTIIDTKHEHLGSEHQRPLTPGLGTQLLLQVSLSSLQLLQGQQFNLFTEIYNNLQDLHYKIITRPYKTEKGIKLMYFPISSLYDD